VLGSMLIFLFPSLPFAGETLAMYSRCLGNATRLRLEHTHILFVQHYMCSQHPSLTDTLACQSMCRIFVDQQRVPLKLITPCSRNREWPRFRGLDYGAYAGQGSLQLPTIAGSAICRPLCMVTCCSFRKSQGRLGIRDERGAKTLGSTKGTSRYVQYRYTSC
jgi:hypothetical protein